MRMKPIAIALGILVLILRFYVGDYDQADAKLEAFYAQMLSADFLGARKNIDEAISLWPSNARYYGWRAYLASQNLPPTSLRSLGGDQPALKNQDRAAAQRAIEDYRRALTLNSHDAVAHHNLAWLEKLLGDDKRAGDDWGAAVAIDPGNAEFHLSWGMFLEATGDKQRAQDEYEVAIDLSPSILDSQFFARYRMRSKNDAELVLNRVTEKLEAKIQQGSDPILEARLAKLYLFRGDFARASRLLEDASRQLPNLPLVWLNLGEAHERQGHLAEAMDCYRKAQVINGSLAGPYLRMGELQLQNGQKTDATQSFTQAIQRWQRVTPVTAAHNNRLYVGTRQRIDDLLPTTLVWYSTPCEASQAWQGLSQLYPQKREYAARTKTCESLPSPHTFENPNEGFKP